MASRVTVSVSLSPELHAVAERVLTSGRYGNFSKVVRAALRLLDERESGFQAHRAAHVAPHRDTTTALDT